MGERGDLLSPLLKDKSDNMTLESSDPKIETLSPPKEPLTRRQILKRTATGLMGFGTLFAGEALVLEPSLLTLDKITIPIKGLSPAFVGYRIAFIADLHYPRYMHPEFIRHAISLANRHHPDLMVFGGDMCDKKGSATVPKLKGMFDHAEAKEGILGVLGNHDHWLDAPGIRRELTRHTPIRLIENESLLLERGGGVLAIGGVGDHWEGVENPAKAFEKVAPEIPRIMVAHNPDLAEELAIPVRVDLQISGHMHGGQIVVPGYGGLLSASRYGKKFCQGLVQGKVHPVYVTRGLFSTGHMRINCPPAVSIITLATV